MWSGECFYGFVGLSAVDRRGPAVHDDGDTDDLHQLGPGRTRRRGCGDVHGDATTRSGR